MESDIKKIRQVLMQNRYMTIATASASGDPWISIVTFAYDDDVALYWCSQDTSLHSKNIDENPFVAISICSLIEQNSGVLPVIYIKAVAQLAPKDVLDEVIQLYEKRMETIIPQVKVNPNDVFLHFPMKMYMAIPEEVYTLKESSLYSHEWIDCRVPLQFKVNK